MPRAVKRDSDGHCHFSSSPQPYPAENTTSASQRPGLFFLSMIPTLGPVIVVFCTLGLMPGAGTVCYTVRKSFYSVTHILSSRCFSTDQSH